MPTSRDRFESLVFRRASSARTRRPGECQTARQDYPEPGLVVHRCFLDLGGLPAAYVGGHLTANTIISRKPLGEESDAPGYIQPSIAMIRLWKHR
jgi:hypothetical protein